MRVGFAHQKHALKMYAKQEKHFVKAFSLIFRSHLSPEHKVKKKNMSSASNTLFGKSMQTQFSSSKIIRLQVDVIVKSKICLDFNGSKYYFKLYFQYLLVAFVLRYLAYYHSLTCSVWGGLYGQTHATHMKGFIRWTHSTGGSLYLCRWCWRPW